MKRWIYSELKEKVELDLDLQEEQFISDTEMMGYANEAIDYCEAVIHQLNQEDEYFRTKDVLTLISGTAEYDMPTNIYGNKLRSVMFKSGDEFYPIRRFRGTSQFQEMLEADSAQPLKYTIDHSEDLAPQMVFYPTPDSSHAGANVTRWFIRNAKRITAETDVCDIPECGVNYVLNFMKFKCLSKEGHPSSVTAKAELDESAELMLATLSEMVVDGDNEMEIDTSIYGEHS